MEYIFGRRSDGVENLLTKGKEAYFFTQKGEKMNPITKRRIAKAHDDMRDEIDTKEDPDKYEIEVNADGDDEDK